MKSMTLVDRKKIVREIITLLSSKKGREGLVKALAKAGKSSRKFAEDSRVTRKMIREWDEGEQV